MAEKKPRWYQEAIIYELHVRAFFDSNADGNGDFRGLMQKLDYLQDIGITAIWLLPFYPSPLRDDGYDIADYTSVNKSYGTLADFKLFMREAHRRNLRVITELVLNHTSDQHPWFQRARLAKPGSNWRNFYVWNDNAEKYSEARIIFKDFETSNWTWDPVAKAYYWHRFYSHQPDLNYDNPSVQKATTEWIDFWMDMGVDGLRLDAVPYLFEREGTNCENLPETHQFLKQLRKYMDDKYPDRMLLAEANQWPEDAIAYFGDDDECNMAFHFPLMPRMFMSLQMEDRFPLIDIMQQTPHAPGNSQWSIFLRNHDELTLEMVTDEERDYMYRVYAQDPQARINLGIRRRLAPLLNNNRKKIELMNVLLFSFPGTPVIYYGDEIGMGDNFYLGDRNGVRTPMQWSADRNAGFSQAHPHRLFLPINVDPEYHYESINVATQQGNPESLLWWMKKLIALRKRYRALSLGRLNFLHPENAKVLAYVAQYEDEKILVIANLSRFAEYIELDLAQWQGEHLIELFSHNSFPAITEKPYFFTLGPHSFYWFLMQPASEKDLKFNYQEQEIPQLTIPGEWAEIFHNEDKSQLEDILSIFIINKRWFNQKSQTLKSVKIIETVPFSLLNSKKSFILFIKTINVQDGEDTYLLPITFISDEYIGFIKDEYPMAIITNLTHQKGFLIDACYDRDFNQSILKSISHNGKLKGINGVITSHKTAFFNKFFSKEVLQENPLTLKGEQSNSSIIYDKKLILKFYRRCQYGINPDLEVSKFLTEKARFEHVPPLAGYLQYQNKKGEIISLGLLQKYCEHESNAWQYTLHHISRFYEHILSLSEKPNLQLPSIAHFYQQESIPVAIQGLLSNYGNSANLLGERTAQMHLALAMNYSDPAFNPEPFTTLYQRTLYQSIRGHAGRMINKLNKALANLPEKIQDECRLILEAVPNIENAIQKIIQRKIKSTRIRIHGDFHLGQVLYTGKDFCIVDFEGEPERPLSERRIKRSPLRDVAGMIRSFDYAAQFALYGESSNFRDEDIITLKPWALFWRKWISVYYLEGYLRGLNGQLIPDNKEDFMLLLQIFLLDKAIYEIQYELNNRPNWLIVPCHGILELLS